MGTIKHLFRQSDKHRLPCSVPRCNPGAPCTTGILAGKAVARSANDRQWLNSRTTAEPAPGLSAHGTSKEVEHWCLVAGRSPRQFVARFQALLHVPQNPGNQYRLLSATAPALLYLLPSGSRMRTISRGVPPQWGPVSMSMANTRLKRCARDIRLSDQGLLWVVSRPSPAQLSDFRFLATSGIDQRGRARRPRFSNRSRTENKRLTCNQCDLVPLPVAKRRKN
jgi:hypothetical protein